jgi:hypothetical protein
MIGPPEGPAACPCCEAPGWQDGPIPIQPANGKYAISRSRTIDEKNMISLFVFISTSLKLFASTTLL